MIEIEPDKLPTGLSSMEIPIFSGTGCQYKCAFCDHYVIHGFKLRSIKNIVESINDNEISLNNEIYNLYNDENINE